MDTGVEECLRHRMVDAVGRDDGDKIDAVVSRPLGRRHGGEIVVDAVAGDLALVFAAQGGIYLGGGIAPRLLAILANGTFRRRFEAKGAKPRWSPASRAASSRAKPRRSMAAQIMAHHRR
jgi:hypothetical protein